MSLKFKEKKREICKRTASYTHTCPENVTTQSVKGKSTAIGNRKQSRLGICLGQKAKDPLLKSAEWVN